MKNDVFKQLLENLKQYLKFSGIINDLMKENSNRGRSEERGDNIDKIYALNSALARIISVRIKERIINRKNRSNFFFRE